MGKMRWKLANQVLKKDDQVGIRLGGRWILTKIDYSDGRGYSVIVEPEYIYIPLSSDMKMRWSVGEN